jgi:hypothetical protein
MAPARPAEPEENRRYNRGILSELGAFVQGIAGVKEGANRGVRPQAMEPGGQAAVPGFPRHSSMII